jgi:hypothetical protein
MAAALAGLRADPEAALGRWLGIRAIFGEDLAANAVFRGAVLGAVRRLARA